MTEQTQKVWEADLGEIGRKLTPEELSALEAMHQCRLLHEIAESLRALVLYSASLEGRFDRLEQFLSRLDPERYPAGPEPTARAGMLAAGLVRGGHAR